MVQHQWFLQTHRKKLLFKPVNEQNRKWNYSQKTIKVQKKKQKNRDKLINKIHLCLYIYLSKKPLDVSTYCVLKVQYNIKVFSFMAFKLNKQGNDLYVNQHSMTDLHGVLKLYFSFYQSYYCKKQFFTLAW